MYLETQNKEFGLPRLVLRQSLPNVASTRGQGWQEKIKMNPEVGFPSLRFLPGDPPADLHCGRSAGFLLLPWLEKSCPALSCPRPLCILQHQAGDGRAGTTRLHFNSKLAHVPEETIKPLQAHRPAAFISRPGPFQACRLHLRREITGRFSPGWRFRG